MERYKRIFKEAFVAGEPDNILNAPKKNRLREDEYDPSSPEYVKPLDDSEANSIITKLEYCIEDLKKLGTDSWNPTNVGLLSDAVDDLKWLLEDLENKLND